MPKKICNERGCNNLISMKESRCPKCAEKNAHRKRERDKNYQRNIMPEHLRKFYNSAAWKRFRLSILKRDYHLCQRCLKDGHVTPATIVHHIIEIREDFDKRLDKDNCESVCRDCHSKINHKK